LKESWGAQQFTFAIQREQNFRSKLMPSLAADSFESEAASTRRRISG
jgi:hypothetical protein